MSWQYPQHICGHAGERYQAYGHHSNRARQLAAAEARPCPTCRRAASDQQSETMHLPKLCGSSKQVAWASEIRERTLRLQPADISDRLRPESSAKWWIEHRNLL